MSTLKHLNINGTSYDIGVVSPATTATEGLMSAADKQKLDGFNPSSCYVPIQSINTGSTSTVQNAGNGIGLMVANSTDVSNITISPTELNIASTSTLIQGLPDTPNGLTYAVNKKYADSKTAYGTSTTGATTQTKVVTCSNFMLEKGQIISIKFTYGNQYSSGALKLNVNSTGDKTIYIRDAATSSSNNLFWAEGEIVTFIYDGTYFRYISQEGFRNEINQIQNKIGFGPLYTPSTANLINAINSINILNLGTPIPEYSDLNDYYNTGIYYSSIADYNNLSNYPEEMCYSYDGQTFEYLPNFKLTVSKQTVSICKQELFTYDSGGEGSYPSVFFRFGNLTGQVTWGPWHKYLTSIESLTESTLQGNIPGFSQNPASTTLNLGYRNLKILRGNHTTNQDMLTNITIYDDRLTLGSTHDSSSDSVGGVYGRDSENKLAGSVTFGVSPEGKGYVCLGARNSADNSNKLTLYKAEDGTNSINVSSPTAWRSALGLGSVLSDITDLQDGLVVQSFSGTRQSTLSSGTCQGIYIPLLGLVIIEFHFTASSTVGTSTNLYTIASKYRPSSGKVGSGYGKSSTATGGLTISINTSGQIRQGTMSACAGGFGILVYTI